MDRTHWEGIYRDNDDLSTSWYQADPALSLEYVAEAAAGRRDACVIDVGGGTARLADGLIERGFSCLGVLDIAQAALDRTRRRLGGRGEAVRFVRADISEVEVIPGYEIWHDRAVLHFLTEAQQVDHYVKVLERSIPAGGGAVIATFGPEGPESCSGLPVTRYSAESLRHVVGASFTLRRTELVTHQKPMGGEQQFLYCRFSRN